MSGPTWPCRPCPWRAGWVEPGGWKGPGEAERGELTQRGVAGGARGRVGPERSRAHRAVRASVGPRDLARGWAASSSRAAPAAFVRWVAAGGRLGGGQGSLGEPRRRWPLYRPFPPPLSLRVSAAAVFSTSTAL